MNVRNEKGQLVGKMDVRGMDPGASVYRCMIMEPPMASVGMGGMGNMSIRTLDLTVKNLVHRNGSRDTCLVAREDQRVDLERVPGFRPVVSRNVSWQEWVRREREVMARALRRRLPMFSVKDGNDTVEFHTAIARIQLSMQSGLPAYWSIS